MPSPENNFRSVEEIPLTYRSVFQDYPCFNVVQSTVLDEALKTDNSIVVSAPTGSGKTAIFEMTIIRVLACENEAISSTNKKIIYISPVKALCRERLVDWHKKFSNFGVKCISITGDTDEIDVRNISQYNLILSTPEKWDVLTRRWRENINLIGSISLFLIDEVHLLNADSRGSTLEVIVSRMKTAAAAITLNGEKSTIRFVALSATVPNIEDVAEWIGSPGGAKYFKFSEDARPVKLNKIVLGYYFNPQNQSAFKFDMSMNYKLPGLISKYSEGKPTLIFCNTRKSVEMTANHLVSNLQIRLTQDQKDILMNISQQLSEAKLKQNTMHGIAFHHAGMVPDNRFTIEESFRKGHLPVLVTTSTLAMGVNLPAHLVIVKSTKCYSEGGYRDYDEVSIFQMIGRAGRCQFDSSATALILTSLQDKEKYEQMLACTQTIESNLHKHLTEHLNAEVVLRTITDLEVAMRWLSSTFLYVRARRSPEKYKLPAGLSKDKIDKKLLDMCQIDLNKLVSGGMVKMNQAIEITPTVVGEIMAKYYVAFDTMKLFTQISGSEILIQILALISKCKEFSKIYLRINDKKYLNMLNKSSKKESNRFPLTGRIKTVDMKINVIIQAVLGNLEISDQSILCDSVKIMRNCERLTRCLIEYLETRDKCYNALLNTCILAKCFRVKLWENSPYVSKQLTGVGQVISTLLTKAGKTSFKEIASTNPRHLEMIVNRKAPFGSTLVDEASHLPEYNITLQKRDEVAELVIELSNPSRLEEKSTIDLDSMMILLVGDSDNNILLYEKYTHSYMIENPKISRTLRVDNKNLDYIKANLISEDWVGIDCACKLELSDRCPVYENNQNCKNSRKQTFLEVYMQHVKRAEMYKKNNENKNHCKGISKCTKKKVEAQRPNKSPAGKISKGNKIKEFFKNDDTCKKQTDLLGTESAADTNDKGHVSIKLSESKNEQPDLDPQGPKNSQNSTKKARAPKKKTIIVSKSIFRTASKSKHDKKKNKNCKPHKESINNNSLHNTKENMSVIEVVNDGNNTLDFSTFEASCKNLQDEKISANKEINSKRIFSSAVVDNNGNRRNNLIAPKQVESSKNSNHSDYEAYKESYGTFADEFHNMNENMLTKNTVTENIEHQTISDDQRPTGLNQQQSIDRDSHNVVNNNNNDNDISNPSNGDKISFDAPLYGELCQKYKLPTYVDSVKVDGRNENSKDEDKETMGDPFSTVGNTTFEMHDFFVPKAKKPKKDEHYASAHDVFPQKSIRWRSPLVHSPAEKFSPRKSEFGFSFGGRLSSSKDDTRESGDFRLGFQDTTNTSSMNSTPFETMENRLIHTNAPLEKPPKKKPKFQFPLSDQDCMEEENVSFNRELKELNALCDPEYFGLSIRPKQSTANSSQSYVGKYYSNLVMNSQSKRDQSNLTPYEISSHSKSNTRSSEIKSDNVPQSQEIFSEHELAATREIHFSKPCSKEETKENIPNENNMAPDTHSFTQPVPLDYYHDPTSKLPRRNCFENESFSNNIFAPKPFNRFSNPKYPIEYSQKYFFDSDPNDQSRYPVQTSPYFSQPLHERPVVLPPYPVQHPCLCCGPSVSPFYETIAEPQSRWDHVDSGLPYGAVPAYCSRTIDVPGDYHYLNQIDDHQSWRFAGDKNMNSPATSSRDFCRYDNFVNPLGNSHLNATQERNRCSYGSQPNPIFEHKPSSEDTLKKHQFDMQQLSGKVSQIFAPTPKRQLLHNRPDFNFIQNRNKPLAPRESYYHSSLSPSTQRRMLNFNSFEERLDNSP